MVSGIGETLTGVFGIGHDLVHAVSGRRPWNRRDLDEAAEIRAFIALVEAKYEKSVQRTAQDTAVSASDVLLVRRTHSLRARRIILSSVRSYTISGMNKDNSFRRRPCSIERPASKMEASLSELG